MFRYICAQQPMAGVQADYKHRFSTKYSVGLHEILSPGRTLVVHATMYDFHIPQNALFQIYMVALQICLNMSETMFYCIC
jgi:hypothetical protein